MNKLDSDKNGVVNQDEFILGFATAKAHSPTTAARIVEALDRQDRANAAVDKEVTKARSFFGGLTTVAGGLAAAGITNSLLIAAGTPWGTMLLLGGLAMLVGAFLAHLVYALIVSDRGVLIEKDAADANVDRVAREEVNRMVETMPASTSTSPPRRL